MSTVVDPPATRPADAGAGRARRWWWLVPELVLIVAAGIAAHYAPSPIPVGELKAQLTGRATAAIEQLSPAQHHDHGHDLAEGQTKIACVTELMGYVPADAGRLSDVRTAYVYYLCAAGAPGQPYLLSSHLAGPAAIDLRPGRDVVRIPGDGSGYAERVRALIPEQYQAWAVHGFQDRNIPNALVGKYNTLVGATPSP